MRFKVTANTLDSIQKHWYFDSNTNQIFDSNNQLISLKDDPRLLEFKNQNYKPLGAKVPKKLNVSHLRIQIGLNCNFSCKYCNQGKCRDSFKQESKISLPPESSVKNFINLLKKYNVTVSKRINLWGGEPLVYWKTLKLLIPALYDLYPTVQIAFITNGSLLNNEIIEFLIKYRVCITLSHDAQGFKAYRDDADPLENPKIVHCIQKYLDASAESEQFWNNLPTEEKEKIEIKAKYKPFGFSINTVITPANLDIDTIPAYFNSKLNRDVVFHFESIVKPDREAKKILGSLSEDQKKLISNKLFKNALNNSVNPSENPFYSLRAELVTIISTLYHGYSSKLYDVKCDVASDRNLAIDMQGNILGCHGADAKHFSIGHISNIEGVYNNKVIGWTERPHCQSCPLISFCGGGCAIASNEDSEAMCEYLKIYYGSLFAAAWLDLFGAVIKSIEPCPEMEN